MHLAREILWRTNYVLVMKYHFDSLLFQLIIYFLIFDVSMMHVEKMLHHQSVYICRHNINFNLNTQTPKLIKIARYSIHSKKKKSTVQTSKDYRRSGPQIRIKLIKQP